jgi:hypothetical protein
MQSIDHVSISDSTLFGQPDMVLQPTLLKNATKLPDSQSPLRLAEICVEFCYTCILRDTSGQSWDSYEKTSHLLQAWPITPTPTDRTPDAGMVYNQKSPKECRTKLPR